MDENPTDLMAEFQKLRQETSGISRNLMASARSVDARRSCCSNTNKAVLKVMNENFKAIRKEIETAQKKQSEVFKTQQDAQNQLMKELLEELRSVRNDVVQMKNKQEEDREEIENIKTITCQIQETLRNPKIVELCGYWTLSPEDSRSSNVRTFMKKLHFSEEGNMLTWSCWENGRQRRLPKVRIGSNECKIGEDGKIEIRFNRKFELEVKEEILTIEFDDNKTVYIKSND